MLTDTDIDYDDLYRRLRDSFDGFILVGYQVDGKRIQINAFDNPVQEDALETFLRRTLNEFANPSPVVVLNVRGDDDEEY